MSDSCGGRPAAEFSLPKMERTRDRILGRAVTTALDGAVFAALTLAAGGVLSGGRLQVPVVASGIPAIHPILIAAALLIARALTRTFFRHLREHSAFSFPAALITGSMLLSLMSLLPLFLPGIPLNLDLPVHYQRLWGFTQSSCWSLAPYWNPFLNAGYAPFQAYPILAFGLIAALEPAVGLSLAFKLGLLLIHFLLPVIGFRFFTRRNQPFAGSLAFSFLLLQPGGYQFGGYSQLFIFGMLASVMASAVLVWAIDRTLRYWEQPSRRAWSAIAIAYALTLLAHVMQFSILLLIIPAMWMAASRRIRHLAGSAVGLMMGGLLAAFWFFPVVRAHAVGLYGNTFTQGAGLTQFGLDLLWDVGLEKLWPLLVALLPAALCAMARTRQKSTLALFSAVLAIMALWLLFLRAPAIYARLPWAKTMELERSMQDFRSLILLLAALGGEAIYRYTVSIRHPVQRVLLPALATALIAVSAHHLRGTLSFAQQQLNLPNDLLVSYQVLYELVPPDPGRILHQEVLGRVTDPRHYHSHLESLCPVLSGREAIVFDGIFMREPLGGYGLEDMLGQMGWDRSRLQSFFQRWNITTVVVSTEANRQRLSWLRRAGQAGEWTILATDIEPAYFESRNGTIISADYDGSSARAGIECSENCSLALKVHDSPNWTVSDSQGRRVAKTSLPGARLEIALPPGRHQLLFEYGCSLLDVCSHILSLVSWAALCCLARSGR